MRFISNLCKILDYNDPWPICAQFLQRTTTNEEHIFIGVQAKVINYLII